METTNSNIAIYVIYQLIQKRKNCYTISKKVPFLKIPTFLGLFSGKVTFLRKKLLQSNFSGISWLITFSPVLFWFL